MRGIKYLLVSLILVICVNEYLSGLALAITTTSNSEGANSTETQCTNISSLPLVTPSVHSYPEENITVSTVRSRSLLGVQIITEVINNVEVKSLLINKTSVVNIETKTITPSKIYIKTTNSISPTTIRVLIGSGQSETLNNETNPIVTTTETTTPNPGNLTTNSYCSKPAQTNTTTESSTIAGDTCSKITSASSSTTITTTEEVIVLGPDGSSQTCTYY
ncbi:uncharacterized protein LOC143982391 [Lithobates pipiens]